MRGVVGPHVGLDATMGVLVTTSGFSQGAVDVVRHLSRRAVLLDRQRLADLMTEHDVGVPIRRTVDFERLDEDVFTEEA